MPENFFRRWARRKAENTGNAGKADEDGHRDVSASAADGGNPGAATRLPTMTEVEFLDAESDYSLFLAKGVDKAVRQAAMKKLFSDPHFHVMDGLDIYIDDYTKAAPLPVGMLAALRQAQTLLEPGRADRSAVLAATTPENAEETRASAPALGTSSGLRADSSEDGADAPEADSGAALDDPADIRQQASAPSSP